MYNKILDMRIFSGSSYKVQETLQLLIGHYSGIDIIHVLTRSYYKSF
jgi:hypothetical protein